VAPTAEVISFTEAVESTPQCEPAAPPGTGIEERARQTGQSLCTLPGASGGIAGGQDHPVGVQLEGCDLGGREIPFVSVGLLGRRCQDQAGPRWCRKCRPTPSHASPNAQHDSWPAGPQHSNA
jgi:hypothetical protein